jgi:hypothetical protein
MERVNSTMRNCKKFCKCHNVPQHNNKKRLKIINIFSVHTTQSNLQIKCNLHQNTNDILHRFRKINPKILNIQSKLEQKEQSQRHDNYLTSRHTTEP